MKKSKTVVPLSHHATVDIGVVTGKNQFFVVGKEEMERFDICQYTIPLVARSSHLSGRFLADEWRSLVDKGERLSLLYLNERKENTFSNGLREYIKIGENAGFHKGYKCSIRKPWYTLPSMWVPNMFFFRQIYDFPRVVVNRAGATSTDTIHRMQCKGDPKILAGNLYTHLAAASAEIEGRSYGGGVLELEPNEAEMVLAPRDLYEALPLEEVNELIRAGRIADVLAQNDRLVLINGLGLTKAECEILCGIWVRMRDRRKARGRAK